MKSTYTASSVVLLLVTTAALAQSATQTSSDKASSNQQGPLIVFNKDVYGGLKAILLRSADKMPEESYSFRPTEAVRSYGQILGHVADAQYLFCSRVLGEKNPAPKIEQSKTTKADLIAALKDAFTYCEKAYDSMTDATAVQMVTFFGGDTPKLGVLTANNMHSVEHYGNLVTYMRMKNIVPPTSEPGFMATPKK